MASAADGDAPDDAHHVIATSDLGVGDHVLVEIDGIEIAVYRTADGYHAVGNFCVHQGGPVCEGPVSGKLTENEDGRLQYDDREQVVRCPWHGWEFDIESGEHLARPQYRLPTYDTMVENGQLYVRW
jgi:nitrite reductase/ring-hydroxylating ferredoxin subunit